MGLDISQFSPSFEFSLPRSRIILRAEKGKAECRGGDVFQAATGGHLDLQSFLLFAANAQPTLRHNCFSAAPSGRQSYYVLPSSPIRPV